MSPFTALMVKIGGNVKGLQTALVAGTTSLQKFSTTNKTLLRGMGMQFAAFGAIVTGSFLLMTKAAADFESEIKNAAAVTGLVGEDMEQAEMKMSKLAKTLGRTTVFSAKESAKAFYDLSSKGFRPAQMSLEELTPFLNLAAATQSDLTTTTETLTAAIRAFGLNTSEVGRVADIFTSTIGNSAATIYKFKDSMSYAGPAAKTAGVEIDELAASLGTIFDLGIPASMAGTAIRRSFAELMSPSEKLKEMMDEVGLSMYDLDLKAHGFVGVLKNMDEAGFEGEMALEGFGLRAGPVIARLLQLNDAGIKGYEAIAKLNKVNVKAGETARVAAEQLKSLKNQTKLMTSAWNGLFVEIGEHFLPLSKKIMKFLAEVGNSITELIERFPNLSKFVIGLAFALGLLATALGSIALILSVGSLATLLTNMGLVLTALMGPIGGTILALGLLVGALIGLQIALKDAGGAWGFMLEVSKDVHTSFRTMAESAYKFILVLEKIPFLRKKLGSVKEDIVKIREHFNKNIKTIEEEQAKINAESVKDEKDTRDKVIAIYDEFMLRKIKIDEQYQAMKKSFEAELTAWEKEQAEYRKEIYGDEVDTRADAWIAMRNGFRNLFVDAFSNDLKDAKDYFIEFGQAIVNSWAERMSEMVADWIWAQIIMFKKQQETKKIGTILGALNLVGGGASSIASSGGTAVGSAFSGAGAPAVGSFTTGYAGGIQSTGAATSALSSVKSYAKGTINVPSTGLAMVHKGETITPKHETGRPLTIINLIDEKLVPAMMMKNPNAVLNIVNADIIRGGQTRKNIMEFT